jgi:heavy metal sensor kinase
MRLDRLRDLFHSLRFRLSAWNTVVMAASILVTLIAVHQGLRYTLLAEMDQMLVEETQELELAVRQLYPNLEQIHEEMNRKALGHEYRHLFVQLVEPDGQEVWSSLHTPQDARGSFSFSDHELPRTLNNYRIVQRRVRSNELPEYTIRVGSSLDYVLRDLARLTQLMLLIAGVSLVIAPIVGYWLAGRATRPLWQIIRTAANLRPSRLEERLPLRHTGDELDQLSDTINRLLDRIAEYLARNREFITNAAHELRSPLAAVQSAVEVALNSDRSTDEYKELLYDIVEECSDLGVLVNQLLLLAESDNASAPIRQDFVRLDQLVARSVEMFQGVADERGIALVADHLAALAVRGDASRLRQVVNNLVDNALKFTAAEGKVVIELRFDSAAHEVRLSVADTGQGIPPGDLPHIFERFYRGDKSRQRESATRGNGLGLSICQSIVAAHGGRMTVESELQQGSRFSVYLPAVEFHAAFRSRRNAGDFPTSAVGLGQ